MHTFINIKNKKIIKFILILLLFFFGSAFQMIPMKIFNIKSPTDNQQIYLSLFSNIIILIILIFIYRRDLKEDFIDFKNNFSKILGESFRIWTFGIALMAIFNILINMLSPNTVANNEESLRNMITINPAIMLIATSLAAPIIEELIFRKSFKVVIKNDIAFVLISGLVFGALHVILSVENLYDYLYLLPYCSLGLAFSYIYCKTKNIFGPISMHMIHNFIITLLNIFLAGVILC